MTTIVYVSTSHPSYSETFVTEEIRQVSGQMRTFAYSLRKPPKGLTPASPYVAPPRSVLGMALWMVFALIAQTRSEFRVRLRPASGVRGLGKHLFTVAHGLRLRHFIWRKLRAENVVVHAHFLARPAEVARLARQNTVVTVHASDSDLQDTTGARQVIAAISLFRCASEFVRDRLLDQWPALPTVVIPCVVSPDIVSATAARVPSSTTRIVTIARLIPSKGYLELADGIEAYGLLHGRSIEWHIVGDGPQSRELDERIAKLPRSVSVTRHGAISHARALQVLSSGSLFALLSRPVAAPGGGYVGDGLPVVLIEALATGVPVLTTPVAGIPELVIDGVTGRLVDSSDPVEIAGGLNDLSLRGAAYGEAGVAHVRKRFSPEVTVPQVIESLASAASIPNPRG